MRRIDNRLLLSASDLNTYLGCPHASGLDYRHSILGEALNPAADDEGLTLLQRRGFEHEQRHFEQLRASARGEVIQLDGHDLNVGRKLTTEAMRRGADLIFQGVLGEEEGWHGYVDFLVRTDQPSGFGLWSYEIHDTKLARSLRPKFAIQLALYADLLAPLQGTLPPAMRVVLGNGTIETLQTRDFIHYVRHAMRRLETAVAQGGHVEPAQDTPQWAVRCMQRVPMAKTLH